MNLQQIREIVSAGNCNQPLPRRNQIHGKRFIVLLTRSKCCDHPELLVRSRDGGFVTRDCLNCGRKANYVHRNQIPDLDCELCRRTGRLRTVEPILKNRNYWYRCEGCRREWEIAEIVPIWSDAFEYSGIAAPGDPAFTR